MTDLNLWDCLGRVKFVYIAKFHSNDLVISSHSREGKTPSYSQINTVYVTQGYIYFFERNNSQVSRSFLVKKTCLLTLTCILCTSLIRHFSVINTIIQITVQIRRNKKDIFPYICLKNICGDCSNKASSTVLIKGHNICLN